MEAIQEIIGTLVRYFLALIPLWIFILRRRQRARNRAAQQQAATSGTDNDSALSYQYEATNSDDADDIYIDEDDQSTSGIYVRTDPFSGAQSIDYAQREVTEYDETPDIASPESDDSLGTTTATLGTTDSISTFDQPSTDDAAEFAQQPNATAVTQPSARLLSVLRTDPQQAIILHEILGSCRGIDPWRR